VKERIARQLFLKARSIYDQKITFIAYQEIEKDAHIIGSNNAVHFQPAITSW
jgi:hypothetical protein